MHQANPDYKLWKEMLKNVIMRESMEGKLLQDRNEHVERDLKQSINLITNCNGRHPMEKANLCFCGSKRVLASVHGPKGRKGGQDSIDGLFVSSFYHYSTYHIKLKWK